MLDLEGLEVVFGFGIVVSPGATLDLEHTRFLNPYLSGGRNESKNCNGFVTDPVISGQSASTLEIPTLECFVKFSDAKESWQRYRRF